MPLILGGMYLRVRLNDCLPPRCMRLFGVGPEEIVLVGGSGLLLCLGSCLGASGGALWLCDRRSRYGGRHGGQCRWMCGMEAIEVEQQLQAVVWCSGRRDDGKVSGTFWFGPPHLAQPQPHGRFRPCFLAAPQSSAAVRNGPLGETFRFPYHVVGREGSEWFSVVNKRTWEMESFTDCEYSHRLAIAAWKAHELQLTSS
jgi:hypothetical protein